MSSYAKRRDLYTYGLPRGSLGSAPSREVASSKASNDVLELDDHGLEDGDKMFLRAISGGTLSSPIVEGTPIYAIRVSDSRFKVAASYADAIAGTPINLTTDGSSMVLSVPIDIDAILVRYSRFFDGFMPAHAVPLPGPTYPVEVTAIVAEVSAAKVQFLSGVTSVSMKDAELSAREQCKRYAAGLPLRDAAMSAPTNLSVVGRSADERRLS